MGFFSKVRCPALGVAVWLVGRSVGDMAGLDPDAEALVGQDTLLVEAIDRSAACVQGSSPP